MKTLIAIVVSCAGCEGLTSIPEPTVSVLKQTEAGCFGLMTPDAPIASELGVPGTCAESQPARLFGGVDQLEVVIDYGADVDFAGATAAPPPTVSLTVDGAPSIQPITISGEHRVGGRVYFVATLVAPSTPSIDMQITAGVDATFQTTSPTVFTIILPPVTLDLIECPAAQICELAGAVGSAHIRVAVTGQVPQLVTVHTLLDGLPLADTLPPVLTELAAGHTEHTTAIPVPAARANAQWLITAQLGETTPVTVTAILDPPAISARLSCGDTCNLAPNEMVGLAITAPAQISSLQALIDTHFNGVPQIIAAPVTLVVNADGTATGTIALHAPASAGTWQVDTSIAGYSTAAIVTTIQ